MKTKIITLESHDDLISVRDRLSWAKTPRILLVWPKYEKVTLRLLDLKVLQRHADSLGAQLGLVTRRANVRRDAESLGIPVFKSTADAQKQPWAPPPPRVQRIPPPPRRDLRRMRDQIYKKEPAWQTSLLGRVAAFTVGVIAVLTLAGLFIPRAAVSLHPEVWNETIVIPVSASPQNETVSITGSIPARMLSTTVAMEETKTITSRIALPSAKANGAVEFRNLTESEVIIPAGAIVATEGLIRFVTLEDAILPAGVDQTAEVRIEALSAGSQGNVGARAILAVEGPLGLSVAVTNPEPTSGGADSSVIGATDEDRAALRDDVLQSMRAAAEAQIRELAAADDMLLLDTLEIKNVLLEEFSPPAGGPGRTLTLTMQAEFTARVISASDLAQLAAATLSASIPPGFSPLDELTFFPRTEPVTDEFGVTRFELEVTQTALRQVDIFKAFTLIRGQDPQTAKTELRTAFSLREEPQIVITPSWWKWLPLIPFNLSVEVK